MKRPIAILTSDWHLRVNPPASRLEKCWYGVMERRMRQIRELQKRLGEPDILVSGDLFDRANPPASLVSWAIEHLGTMNIACIPGQHDLTGHSYQLRMDGAYGALVKAGVITDLKPGQWNLRDIGPDGEQQYSVWALPWNMYETPTKLKHPAPKVIMLHKYVYSVKETAYTGVDTNACVTGITELGNLADVVSIGDNHISWHVSRFLNHGSLFSTTSAQKEHSHHLGILYSDGTFDWMRFPEESVEWVESPANTEVPGVDKVIEELKSLELDAVSFMDQLNGLAENLDENGKNSYKALVESIEQR